jgi:hypothetical protein
MHVFEGGTTTPDGAGRGMVPHMCRAAVGEQRWVGAAWASPGAVLCKACNPPPDVHARPTCRSLWGNNLKGTLPTEWSALTALTYL